MTTLRRLLADEPVRAYLYSVLAAAVAVLAGYGLLSADQAGLWLGLGAALLGAGSAGVESLRSRVTPTRATDDHQT